METLQMSSRERGRLVVLSRVKSQGLTLVAAAAQMQVSYRQAKRLWKRYRKEGDAGLVHRLRGKASNHRDWGDTRRAKAVELYRRQYPDFGPTLAAQCLRERDGLEIDHETLRRALVRAGLWQADRAGSGRHRQWRERRHRAGEMVQMDGSHHDWFEGRGEPCVLMVLIDDASNWTWGEFAPAEDTIAAMRALWSYSDQRGLPQSLYVDKDSIYKINGPATTRENLQNTGARTQFARAMDELGVKIINAHSPQAKGRVERANGTLQDRLVKLMRLEGISDIATANTYLRRSYWAQHNGRFALRPIDPQDAHQPAPARAELDRVLQIRQERTVANDYCVRWENRFFQLTGTDANRGMAGQVVEVCQHLDGRLVLLGKGRSLAYRELKERPSRPARALTSLVERVGHHRGQAVPAPGHPWRAPAVPAAARPPVPPGVPLDLAALGHRSTPGGTGGKSTTGDIST
jgi:transposase